MTSEAQLDTLEAKGLIRLAVSRPELEYLFRHWLVQDAAYGSLLKQERRELHRRVGEALENLYPERVGELAAVLAMHFEEAGDEERAVTYLAEAGKYALERNAIQEAFSAFDRAVTFLDAAPELDDRQRRLRVELVLGRARSSYSFRPMEDAVADLEAILPDAERIGEPEDVAQIHLMLALSRLQNGEPSSEPRVVRSLDRIREIGDQIGDPSLRAMPLALVGLMQVFSGPIRAGVEALEEAVPLLERRRDSIGAAFARGALAIGYANLGEFDKADAAALNASEIAKGGDLIAQLDAQIAESMVRAAEGRLDEAGPLAAACINRAEETGAAACVMASSWVLGDVLHRQGRYEEARKTLSRGSEIATVVDRRFWRPTLMAWLGTSSAALGSPDGGWDEALETARSIGNHIGEAGILAKRGEGRLRAGDVDPALADLRDSAEILEREGSRPNLARVLQGLGQALRAVGRADEAEAPLRRSLALFEEMGLDREAAALKVSLSAGPLRFA
jgi:tetratricopeptide (TPR) repeat protein